MLGKQSVKLAGYHLVYEASAVGKISDCQLTRRFRAQFPTWSRIELYRAIFFATPSVEGDVGLV